MKIKQPSKWAQHIIARSCGPKKVLGRVKPDSIEKIAGELREKFGIDPEAAPVQAVTDWAVAREESGQEDFVSVSYHGGHDLSGLTAEQLLEFANDGTLPAPITRRKK